MRTLFARVVVGLSLLASAPSVGRAEPFAVTGGFLTFDYEGDFFRLAGEGFELGLSTNEDSRFIPRMTVTTCSRCTPGDIVNTSFTTRGEVSLGPATAVIAGTHYTDVALRARLQFEVTPVTFPRSEDATVFVRSPFTASGFLAGFLGSQQVFGGPLSGGGLMFLPFVRRGGLYEWEENRLDFHFLAGQPPEPVPEPGTIGLLAAGLVGCAVCVRARRRI